MREGLGDLLFANIAEKYPRRERRAFKAHDSRRTAAEIIVRARSNPSLANSNYDALMSPLPNNNLSSSCDTLTTSAYGSTLSIVSQGSVKKLKKKSVFSLYPARRNIVFFHESLDFLCAIAGREAAVFIYNQWAMPFSEASSLPVWL
eukprot:gene3384-3874_t